MDDLENLNCSGTSLFLYKVDQPLPGLPDVLDRKKISYKFDYASLSKVTCKRESTHAIVVG